MAETSETGRFETVVRAVWWATPTALAMRPSAVERRERALEEAVRQAGFTDFSVWTTTTARVESRGE